jgi:hypothetical protein
LTNTLVKSPQKEISRIERWLALWVHSLPM